MADSDWICKRCGSDDFVAEVEIRTEVGGRIRERNGKPYLDYALDFWGDGEDVIGYICECGASSGRLEDLVVRRRAFNELRLPCGRCDHGPQHHHLLHGVTSEMQSRMMTRGPMPCTVSGCDCHDFYDQALGLEPNWEPQQEKLVA